MFRASTLTSTNQSPPSSQLGNQARAFASAASRFLITWAPPNLHTHRNQLAHEPIAITSHRRKLSADGNRPHPRFHAGGSLLRTTPHSANRRQVYGKGGLAEPRCPGASTG